MFFRQLFCTLITFWSFSMHFEESEKYLLQFSSCELWGHWGCSVSFVLLGYNNNITWPCSFGYHINFVKAALFSVGSCSSACLFLHFQAICSTWHVHMMSLLSLYAALHLCSIFIFIIFFWANHSCHGDHSSCCSDRCWILVDYCSC